MIQKAVKLAAQRAGTHRRATGHTLRQTLATHLSEEGQDIRTIQEHLGHKDLSTPKIYTHLLNPGPPGVQSAAEA